MKHEEYGQLLMEAIRETMETMAFAEIVPYSMKIGDKELVDIKELSTTVNRNPATTSWGSGWDEASGDDSESDAWGETPACGETPKAQPLMPESSGDAWGSRGADAMPITDSIWANPLDAWEENVAIPIPEPDLIHTDDQSERVDFEKLVSEQNDWCWACMGVNSPVLDCIWFIVSKQLAQELARTMYAGDNFQLDNPVLRDIIAELTNVLGGRLMLLLEEIGGKFTLEVPATGTGHPDLSDKDNHEKVTCKVLVDGHYPVISVMFFKSEPASG